MIAEQGVFFSGQEPGSTARRSCAFISTVEAGMRGSMVYPLLAGAFNPAPHCQDFGLAALFAAAWN
jgi:hypothetical protein